MSHGCLHFSYYASGQEFIEEKKRNIYFKKDGPFSELTVSIVATNMAESSSTSEIRIPSAVRGYHVYKEIWDPFIDDTFTTKHERGNAHDRYAMAVIPDDMKSGWAPSTGDY